ncbi:Drug resistance transporter, Bcr/CflA subfamily [Sphingobium herbicidovorans NBRC 16415]|uniref:Bcr/CflA family efflux transporter n=1 Tax=Sphingobium herbicidovorans (strain ATCC 700291 / DSM 11019 / CCUG 56400 / KCTC 2939 / LMG 18315 / NBRC 16415 / MH) TaxID=1219045 RepID=A0A086P545_SPHHM|nr:multidrug effflux MFS transporter [Sphingobium herbicidovorans]KFG88513.1 Drug resistance transporter, Bcr/CflA subfamily [Sphingobium herbicidovorans NBRC 16415]
MTNLPSPVAPAQTVNDIGFREFVVLSACLMAMNALSTDPMLPALPDIGRDLAIRVANDRQLIISIYFLGLGIGSLLFGILSDRFGRKPVLGSALALFIVSTIGCAAAQSFPMLLAGRFLAGFFAGASRVIAVGIIRDRFKGDAMAKVMSLILAVFMLIPVMAPSFGQVILWFAPWRWIFWILALQAALILLWMIVRMPETLRPENRLRMDASTIFRTMGAVITHRSAASYMLASGMMMSGLIGFILSVQQIFFDIFHEQTIFPIAFAVMAGSMGIGSLLNSRLVSRFGARRLSQGAVLSMILISFIHVAVIVTGKETIFTFMFFQSATMMAVAFTASNFGAISMEPFAKGAGAASSFQAFLTTAVSSALGSVVGRAFDGTTLPLALGMLMFGSAALLIVLFGERGKLFTRPRHDALRQAEFDTPH